MKFVLIENGDLYTPRHAGIQPLLLADGTIARLGIVETAALHALQMEVETVVGTDMTTRHVASLHAKASQLWAEGITAVRWPRARTRTF